MKEIHMNPNSRMLAARDAALAAVMGALPSDFGNDSWGQDDWGADPPTAENQMKAWQEKQATKARENKLYPNRGSETKVERYCFAINQDIVLGVAQALGGGTNLTGKPETEFRPQRVTLNAPEVGFITLDNLKVANVGVIVGGTIDGFDFSAGGQDQALDLPTLRTSNEVKADGAYTGTVPGTLVPGAAFKISLSFKGPSTMAGGR
jgi:hypothetical protein